MQLTSLLLGTPRGNLTSPGRLGLVSSASKVQTILQELRCKPATVQPHILPIFPSSVHSTLNHNLWQQSARDAHVHTSHPPTFVALAYVKLTHSVSAPRYTFRYTNTVRARLSSSIHFLWHQRFLQLTPAPAPLNKYLPPHTINIYICPLPSPLFVPNSISNLQHSSSRFAIRKTYHDCRRSYSTRLVRENRPLDYWNCRVW